MRTRKKQQPNTLFTGDNLYIMHGMDSESVDLIYLDPPFNSKRLYKAPVGSKAAGTSFKDMWSWDDVDSGYLDQMIDDYPYLVQYIQAVQAIHGKPMAAYLTYMTQRIIEMHRILKPTGSFYLHCDPTASHYLKIMLDRIFGIRNFVNEIIWKYNTGGASKKTFSKKHDNLYFYSKDNRKRKFNPQREPYREDKSNHFDQTDRNGRAYRIRELNGKKYKYYLDEGRFCHDTWEIDTVNAVAKERTGYPTQKPLALLRRIIKASSDEGDVVLDPFCGCATTCVAAQQLNRRWIGIDIAEQAAKLVVERLSEDSKLFTDFIHRTDVPQRTDIKTEQIDKNVRKRLYKEQEGKCKACGTWLDEHHLEVDHIIPKSKGGGDYYANYQLLCGHCNRVKGNRPMEYVLAKINQRNKVMKQRVSFGC